MCLHLLPLNQLFVIFTHKKKLFISSTLFNLHTDNKKFYQYQIQNPMISSCVATGGFLHKSSRIRSDRQHTRITKSDNKGEWGMKMLYQPTCTSQYAWLLLRLGSRKEIQLHRKANLSLTQLKFIYMWLCGISCFFLSNKYFSKVFFPPKLCQKCCYKSFVA